jgi:hypothetical protein
LFHSSRASRFFHRSQERNRPRVPDMCAGALSTHSRGSSGAKSRFNDAAHPPVPGANRLSAVPHRRSSGDSRLLPIARFLAVCQLRSGRRTHSNLRG